MEARGLPASGRGDTTGPDFSQRDSVGHREAIRLHNQRHSDEGINLSSLRDTESILQTLAIGIEDMEVFSAFESELDNEHNIHSNYRSSHDVPDELEEDESEYTPTPKSETTISTHEENLEQQP